MLQLPAKFGIATSSFPQVPPNPQLSVEEKQERGCRLKAAPRNLSVELLWQAARLHLTSLSRTRSLQPTALTCSMVEPSGIGIVFKEKAWQRLGFRVQGLGFRV